MDWPQRKFFCVNSFTMLQLLELFVKFSPSNYFRWFMINTDQMFDLVHLLGFEKQMFNRMKWETSYREGGVFALCVRHARSSNQYHTTPGDGLKLQKRRGQGIYRWKTNRGLTGKAINGTNEIRPGEWQLCLVSYSCYCSSLLQNFYSMLILLFLFLWPLVPPIE